MWLSPAPSRSLSALPAENHFSSISCYSWNRVQLPWVRFSGSFPFSPFPSLRKTGELELDLNLG